jgi:hypothetical protein
MTIEQMFLM